MPRKPRTESVWRLRADLATARVLVWLATRRGDGELKPETHWYLGDCYERLSRAHRTRGRHGRARRCAWLADYHFRAGGWNGPPYAAAMAMPRPEPWIAVSRQRMDDPIDVA